MQSSLESNTKTAHSTEHPAPRVESKRSRLLVVDDQPVNIQAVYQIFAGIYQVLMATSGEQAIEVCLKSPPDLILLDVMMPGIDGPETCRRIKGYVETRDIPIIFLTGGSRTEEENVCWEAGGVDFVTKPINPVTLRNRVRVHLMLKQQADLLRDLAFLDGLTGIFNRRYFDERYQAEWSRAQRSGAPLSLIMLDIDYFKRYNDHYGHQAGDDCLRAVATAIKAEVNRPSDLLARYGGEEFICVLPDTGMDGARMVAERIRHAVELAALPHAQSDVAQIVTISVGVATTDAGLPAETPAALLGIADQRLYQSKQSGRNRISS